MLFLFLAFTSVSPPGEMYGPLLREKYSHSCPCALQWSSHPPFSAVALLHNCHGRCARLDLARMYHLCSTSVPTLPSLDYNSESDTAGHQTQTLVLFVPECVVV